MKDKVALKSVCFTDTIALFGNSQIQSGNKYKLYFWGDRGVEVKENTSTVVRTRFFPLPQVRFMEFYDEVLPK